MKMAYNGSQAAVDVPHLGLFGVTPGEPVEIEDQHARGRLAAQGWTYVHDEKTNDDTNDNEKDGDDS